MDDLTLVFELSSNQLFLIPLLRGGCTLYCSSDQESNMTNTREWSAPFWQCEQVRDGTGNRDPRHGDWRFDDCRRRKWDRIRADAKCFSLSASKIHEQGGRRYKVDNDVGLEAALQNDKTLSGISGGGVVLLGRRRRMSGSMVPVFGLTLPNEIEKFWQSDPVQRQFRRARSRSTNESGGVLVEKICKVDFKQGGSS